MAFNPDEYLGNTSDSGFDPDSYLSITPKSDIGVGGALLAGAERGVKQTLGGVTQKVAQFTKSQIESQIDKLASGMQDGSIPATQENIDKLNSLQAQAVKLEQGLSGYEKQEKSDIAAYQPIQEARPVASFAGNVAGQMAALPLPAVQGALPIQMARGAIEGGLISGVQPTVDGETNNMVTGAAIGGAAPAILRPITNAVGAGYRAMVGKPSNEVADIVSYAEQNNLPLMTTDVIPPTTGYGKNIRSFGETVPITGTGAARADQQAARIAQMQKLSDDFGVPNDSEIFDSIVRKGSKITAAAGERYKNIISQMGDDPIPLTNTNKAIDKAIAEHTRGGRLENKALIELLQSIKSKLNESGQDIELLRLNRTDVRERLKTDETIGKDTAARVIDKLYAGMTQDMTNGVASKLGGDAAAKMRQADAIYYREASEIQKTKLKNILSKGAILPDKVNGMLFSKSKPEVEILYQSLDKAGRDNARAAIYSKAYEIAQNSPERFLSEINKLKTQNEVFFKGDNAKQLNGLIKYLSATREASAAAVNTPTGQRLTVLAPAALGGAGGTAAGAGGALAGVGAYFGVGGLARIYESTTVRNLMIKMAGVPKGSTEFERLASQLEQEIAKATNRVNEATQ